ncbi:hypothetical protein F3Y22_tig00111651pilonHSYRG00007 [Hibiscus syriacus]|uniref:RNase H type-1 domain-containing protein n=1 Tax=Hibiscus syriacus TaxID=106335 RepID=A0A6A2XHL5_HIBSY|nr:hypothetical protein F3Y22_tig00111651pilonHSYRG00007 [Hibiscus syriacus]
MRGVFCLIGIWLLSSKTLQLAYTRVVDAPTPVVVSSSLVIHSNSWHKPPLNFVKLNVDGCPLDDGAMAVGAMVQDSDGFVLAGRASCIDCPRNVGSIEFHATCFSLRLVIELGFPRLLSKVMHSMSYIS